MKSLILIAAAAIGLGATGAGTAKLLDWAHDAGSQPCAQSIIEQEIDFLNRQDIKPLTPDCKAFLEANGGQARR